jgi:hypothetical protein
MDRAAEMACKVLEDGKWFAPVMVELAKDYGVPAAREIRKIIMEEAVPRLKGPWTEIERLVCTRGVVLREPKREILLRLPGRTREELDEITAELADKVEQKSRAYNWTGSELDVLKLEIVQNNCRTLSDLGGTIRDRLPGRPPGGIRKKLKELLRKRDSWEGEFLGRQE